MHNFKRFSFFMPGETWIGFSAVEELGRSLIKKRVDRGLIVTDEFMAGSKVTAKVVEVLKSPGLRPLSTAASSRTRRLIRSRKPPSNLRKIAAML